MKNALKFKTNINCSGCVAQVKPSLDTANGVERWEVDTNNKNKILTVEGESLSEENIIEAVKKAGFKIEKDQA